VWSESELRSLGGFGEELGAWNAADEECGRVATRLRRGGDSPLLSEDAATEHERTQSQSRSRVRYRKGRRTPQTFRIDVGQWGGVMAADPDRPSDF
jgi:hypothetical protein